MAVLIGVTLWGGARLRRGAILAGLAAGTACYARSGQFLLQRWPARHGS